jgi:Tfp pilus assembly protein FimT
MGQHIRRVGASIDRLGEIVVMTLLNKNRGFYFSQVVVLAVSVLLVVLLVLPFIESSGGQSKVSNVANEILALLLVAQRNALQEGSSMSVIQAGDHWRVVNRANEVLKDESMDSDVAINIGKNSKIRVNGVPRMTYRSNGRSITPLNPKIDFIEIKYQEEHVRRICFSYSGVPKITKSRHCL